VFLTYDIPVSTFSTFALGLSLALVQGDKVYIF
jgi:hypothetical protein